MNELYRLKEQIQNLHKKEFGRPPQVIAWAPGRAEVLGNHTDYNQGRVLSIAIDRGHLFCISPNQDKGLRLMAGDLEKTVEFDLVSISPVKEAPWASYVKGVFFYLNQAGLKINNWDCSFLGNIPVGSGLSSSAALEVSAAMAAQQMTGQWIDKIETARICQKAEITFAGCNCGLLDQFSSLFGQKNHLILSDFHSLEVSSLPLPSDVLFLMVTPGVTHSLADSPYNQRRESCEQAVREISTLTGKTFASLREVPLPLFNEFRDRIEKESAQRAAHVMTEMDRVKQGIKALGRGDMTLFGELMYQSHESSRQNFENSAPELDLVIQVARSAGAPGARLSGGGWGGSLIVLTREKEADTLGDKIRKECEEQGLPVKISRIIPSEGAGVI